MYVSEKDLKTIAELTAFVDGALESCDGEDIVKYWIDFSKRVNKLESKMIKQNATQKNRKL